MSFQGLLASVGTELVWQLIGTGFALIAALAAAVPLVQRRAVSPLFVVLGGALAAGVVTILARVALFGWSDDPERLKLVLTTFSAVYLVGPLTVLPVAATSFGACAFAGFGWPPLRYGLPSVAAVLVGLTVATIVVAGGLATGNPLYASIRAMAYGVVGFWVAIAMAGRHPTAATAAGALFPLVVAIGEASERGLVNLLLVEQAQRVPTEHWPEAVLKMVAAVAPEWHASLAALGVVSLFAGVGLIGVAPERRPEALGAVGLAVALAWVVLIGSALRAAQLGAMSLSVGAAGG